jgi:hypothetical protein
VAVFERPKPQITCRSRSGAFVVFVVFQIFPTALPQRTRANPSNSAATAHASEPFQQHYHSARRRTLPTALPQRTRVNRSNTARSGVRKKAFPSGISWFTRRSDTQAARNETIWGGEVRGHEAQGTWHVARGTDREAGEDDRVYGSDACASKHRIDDRRRHRHVDDHAVALTNPCIPTRQQQVGREHLRSPSVSATRHHNQWPEHGRDSATSQQWFVASTTGAAALVLSCPTCGWLQIKRGPETGARGAAPAAFT